MFLRIKKKKTTQTKKNSSFKSDCGNEEINYSGWILVFLYKDYDQIYIHGASVRVKFIYFNQNNRISYKLTKLYSQPLIIEGLM